jgi:Coenzyme PQQ synthesis protein D (PqqD)
MLPRPHPNVVFQQLEDGAVLFAPERELYFGLNEVGARIWALLPPAHSTLDELADELALRYADVARPTLVEDARELLDALIREGLARPDASGGAVAASRP